jgi:sec-independent protein translocase protein TatA
MPSWIGPWEIAIVVVIALLIFGPRKLPELGSSFGKSIRGFKQGLKEGQDELNKTVAEVKEAAQSSDAPLANSVSAEAVATTTTAEAVSATATAEAVAQPGAAAVTGDAKPRCWGTYEEGHEACLQCTVSVDCAQAGAQTPAAV